MWQWNCRSYRGKKAVLQQFLKHTPKKPHVILLQETRTQNCTLPGYTAYASYSQGKAGICTLVDKRIAVIEHEAAETNPLLEHKFVELVPGRIIKESVFIMNVYSNPKDHKCKFAAILNKATGKAGSHPLVVAGDFNAQHTAWGYHTSWGKGVALLECAEAKDLQLLTDSRYPTRTGNSVASDTCPDLTFAKNARVEWQNTMEDLGSDHRILETTLGIQAYTRRTIRYVDWDAFRQKQGDRDKPASLDEWVASLQEDIKSATKQVAVDQECPRMDRKLAHLFEAKNAILDRWRQKRLLRRLRKKVADLNRQIQDYSAELAQQQWHETCNSADGQMRAGKKWNLLKTLLNETRSTSTQSRALQKAIHLAQKQDSVDCLIDRLAEMYIAPDPSPGNYPAYEGPQLPELDAPFTLSEVRHAAHKLRGNTAPGLDGITNTALRNLDDRSLELLTEEINRIWDVGEVPASWKTAKVVLIPKPGKPTDIKNLRPISLTSCVGKLMEHVVLDRFSRYCEDKEIFPAPMVGFRPAMSTQDALWLLKQDVLDNNTRDTQAILALDLEKAFDRVRHDHILETISEVGLGNKFHAYVTSFLSDRQALLTAGELHGGPYKIGPKGTPQGAVLSPFLFNLAMIRLARVLDRQPGIRYTMYADDITIWCTGGRDADIEDALQGCLLEVERALEGTGLQCSPAKSELLLYTKQRRREPPDIVIRTRLGRIIPIAREIRILGVHISDNGSKLTTLNKLAAHANSVTQLIGRIASKRGGIREHNLVRLVQAFLISHVAYVASIFSWTLTELEKLERILRKAYKRALGIPLTTKGESLTALGMGNTMRDICEAQLSSQMYRLHSSVNGRRLLASRGITPSLALALEAPVPPGIAAQLYTRPLPKNMNPVNNHNRRTARAKALLKHVEKRPQRACFVDVAKNPSHYVAAAVSTEGQVLNSLSVKVSSAARAEQVAIAMALLDSSKPDIYSDCLVAIKAFKSGFIATEAARLLAGRTITPHTLTWFPGHMGTLERPSPNPNELAHSAAREISRRAAFTGYWDEELASTESGFTFQDITSYYQMKRREYPLPHRRLTRPQSMTFRQLQTRTYSSLHFMNRIHPEAYKAECPACGELSTLDHMLWECPLSPYRDLRTSHEWNQLLSSECYEHQILAVQRAHDAAVELGLPVPSWAAPAP